MRVVLATVCGLGNLECGVGKLKMWSTFSLSSAFYFAEVFAYLTLCMLYVNFENSTCVKMWQQTAKGSIRPSILD